MGITTRIANALSRRSVAGVSWAGSTSVSANPWGEVFLEDDESKWTAAAAGYRCVLAIAANAGSLPLQVRSTADDTNVEGHWLSALWERPNPSWSRRVLAEVLWSRMETKGETFVYVNRGATGTSTPRELWPIFHRVVALVDRVETGTGQVEEEVIGYQVYLPNGKVVGLLPSEVLWLRYPHPGSPWAALPPLAAAGHSVELDAYARAWQRGEFKNGAKPKHVVYLGDLGEDAYNAAVENWRSQVEGHRNAGKSLLLASPEPSKVDRLTMTPEEMSWLETRNISWQETMLAFGVPKDYLLGGATYENRAASRTTLWSDTIVPKLEVVASEITRQLLSGEPGRRARFDTDDVDALQEGADSKAKRATDLTAHDVVTLDEARAEVGLDPLPDGLGLMTLTAYRTWVQFQAQAALLGDQAPAGGRSLLALGPVTPGRVTANVPSAPLLLPSGLRVHGPDPKTILAEYDRHERLVAKAVGRLASRQMAVVLTNADRLLGGKSKKAQAWLRDLAEASLAAVTDTDGDDTAQAELRAKVEDLFDSAHWHDETRDALEGPVGGAWNSGATKLATSLGIDFEKFDLLVLTAMDTRLEALSTQVTATTRQVLEDRVMLPLVAEGASIDTIKAAIRGVFTDLSSWRATTIARTEVVGGFNAASHTIAEASGVVVEREWLATLDTRTRDTHKALDGARVKGHQSRYTNGCLYPGDPTARPEETIMCRCVELYVTED
jgi:HK97 family phage portal protein